MEEIFMKTKINYIKLIILILIPLIVGGISGFLTKDAMFHFNMINKPFLAPAGFIFPIAWSILYILMGISSYLILEYNSNGDVKLDNVKSKCIALYVISLVFNFFWSIIFFGFSLYYLAFVWLIILWVIVLFLIILSFKINKAAAILLIPYILWMTFAAYLNLGIAILN